MSASLFDPFPHATAYTSFPATFPVAARALLLSNFSAGADAITITTVSGETVVIALGALAVTATPIYLPIQSLGVPAVTGVGTVVALWH